MENVLVLMTTAAGLLFSISCAVLIEELVLGGFFKMFFAKPAESKAKPQA